MSGIKLVDFIGQDVRELLKCPPFSGWKFTKSIDEDLPQKEIRFEFKGRGVDLICDEADRITTVFIHRGDGESLFAVPFTLSRREVLERYGTPSKSGSASRSPILGESGAWDLFSLAAAALHVEYRVDRDEIAMITLMRPDVVP